MPRWRRRRFARLRRAVRKRSQRVLADLRWALQHPVLARSHRPFWTSLEGPNGTKIDIPGASGRIIGQSVDLLIFDDIIFNDPTQEEG